MTMRCQRCGCAVKLCSRQKMGVPGYWVGKTHEGVYKTFRLCAPCMVACYPEAFMRE